MSEAKKGQTLKINEQNEMLTIQTNQLALQIIFNSPILDVCNYHEQLEKYNYRAALSSVNLKLDEFDSYYSAVRQRVDTFYNTLMYRSVAMIQDLLISVRFAKIEMWREQTAITNGLRSHLYGREVDPYHFNTQQFNPDIKLVNQIGKTNQISCKQGQQIIGKLLNKLKQIESSKMQQMFSGRVNTPYLAMNKDGVQVDPSSMYESYLTYLLTKMQRSDESIFRKHFAIHDEIIKFGQAIFDHNIKYQKNAAFAIKKVLRYNDSLPNEHQKTNIAPIIKMEVKRQHFDVDQLLPGRQNRSESKPALTNKATKVEFKETNRVLDLQTMSQQTVEHIKNEQRKQYERKLPQEAAIRESPFQTFAQQRRILYKDYYQHRDFQKKIREQQIRYGSKEFKQRQKQRIVIRRIIRSINVPAPWLELAEYECPFIHFLNTRNQKEEMIWQNRARSNQKNPSLFTKKDKDNPILFMNREKQQKVKVHEAENNLQNERKQKLQREQAFAFEDRRYAEEQARLAKIKHKMVNRTYQMYMKMNKMQFSPTFVNNYQVSRFGITLRTVLNLNDPLQIDKFFYNYYKERYYRQNEHVKEMVDNPIIYLDSKKINMSSSPKIIGSFLSSVVKRINSLDFFLLWSDDIISFRLKETKQAKIAEFQCYNYVQNNNTQKLMYEIRRRINLQIKEIHHLYTKLQPLDMVFSKVQVGHRMIFNRHRIMPAPISSAMKGRQLAEQIFQQLKER